MPTATGARCDLASMARAAGVERAVTTRTLEEFRRAAKAAMSAEALHFIVAKVEKGAKKIPLVATDGIEQKYRFVRYLEKKTGTRVISPPTQEMPRELIREG
jgi:thiamine pyrophosphate-dependent acetolactate synthase large subunit-like protein